MGSLIIKIMHLLKDIVMYALFIVSLLPSCQSKCSYIDAHWKVEYNRGLLRYHPDNTPEPPVVTQLAPGKINVRWGHLVKDGHCVDRFILHVWDTKANLMRYIYNSNLTRSASVSVA